jgi:trafficking protein particle complex subunit 6
MSFEPVAAPYNHSDPSANFLSSSALDFLLIELVPLAYRVTSTTAPESSSSAAAGANNVQSLAPADRSSVASPPSAEAADNASTIGASQGAARSTLGGADTAGTTTAGAGVDEEETQDAVHHRLDAAGYRVGQGLVER